MQRLINILTVMLMISGCSMGLSAINKEPSRFQSVIACAQALTLDGSTDSTPNPTKKYRRSECPECHGKGYIMSGDGLFKQNCPYCEPDNSIVGSPWSCPCGGVCQCMNGECKSPNCPTNRSGSTIKGKNISYCNRRDCPCEDCICPPNKCKCKVKNECNQNRVMCGENCVCENGQCKCKNPLDCKKLTLTVNPNGCCQDCICPKGQCKCTYPGECLVKRNGGKSVQVCRGGSCRQYHPKASNSPANSKTTIKPTQSRSSCSSGRCGSSGGWGTSSRGGRRGMFGRGIF